ncbi:vesicle transport protein SEC20 [Prorops nasuta]|uniref:vesicle transport protein SEC20 n=1 Tax=Prorops nasuta TaxID=863751 RepID=UPI0034CE659A
MTLGTQNHEIDLVKQSIVKNHLEIGALIQDIEQCTGPLSLLNELNAEGRKKIAALKSNIDQLASIAEIEHNEKVKSEILSDVETYRAEFTTSLTAFRKSNVISACVIDKLARENLLSVPEEQQNALRKRKDKQGLANASNQITEKLLSISRHLAETTQRSADTLNTLLTSSDKVSGTKDELEHQQQAILQSGKLLGKYGRREITDKALLALAFAFFLACVVYILQKRLF